MSLNRITPPAAKFELHAYGEVYDFSLKSISNWKMLDVTQKRDATSGIFHQISFPFEFVLDAYDVVKRIFETYKYRAKADMYIYLLKDNWPYEENKYYEPEIFNLDWISYNKTDNKIEVDSKRSSLYDFIKAKNKIVYDIPVSAIKEEKQWNFERIELENIITQLVSTEIKDRPIKATGHNVTHPGVTYKASEIAVPNKVNEQTVPDYIIGLDVEGGWFLQSDKLLKEPIMLRIQGTLDIPYISLVDEYNEVQKLMIGFWKKTPTGIINDDTFIDGIVIEGSNFEGSKSYAFDFETELGAFNEELEVGDRLYFMIDVQKGNSSSDHIAYLGFGDGFDFEFKVSYRATPIPETIDLIDPKVLLQTLVDKMTDSEGVYTSEIEDFNTDTSNLIMMSAAESIRGIRTTTDDNEVIITEAEVHTSYRKFTEWINTYGYEQHITGDKLTLRKRVNGFRGDLTAIELEEHECADLRESVNSDYLYSGLKIGYNKKDIENINGRFEFNGVHDYSTDLNLAEKILELISPYRADCYGIEFLTQERGRDSTDDKSDKDLFLVNVSRGDDFYETVRSNFSGNYPNNTIFNANLNPYNLLLLNVDLLGISVNKLRFAASDSNSGIVIDGQAINADYDIPEGTGLFDAIMYDIASKNIQHLPKGDNVNGVVRFKYKGKVYEGFIEEVSKNPAWEMETVWILYKKK